MSVSESLIERLKAMQGKRGDRSPERWLGDGVHPPVSVQELLNALAPQSVPAQPVAIYQQGYPDGMWRDVTESHYKMLNPYCRIVYTAPPAAEQDGRLYTMDQMREYAEAFHKTRQTTAPRAFAYEYRVAGAVNGTPLYMRFPK